MILFSMFIPIAHNQQAISFEIGGNSLHAVRLLRALASPELEIQIASLTGLSYRVKKLEAAITPCLQDMPLKIISRFFIPFQRTLKDSSIQSLYRYSCQKIHFFHHYACREGRTVRRGDSIKINLLTQRDRELIKLVAKGLKNKQIADRLQLSDLTVSHHLTSIYSKLRVTDRFELIVFAYNHSLCDLPEKEE